MTRCTTSGTYTPTDHASRSRNPGQEFLKGRSRRDEAKRVRHPDPQADTLLIDLLEQQWALEPEPAPSTRPALGQTARNLQSLAMFVLAALGVAVVGHQTDNLFSPYGILALGYLASKLGLSLFYRRATDPPPPVSVAVVVPFYNEDPLALRACLESVLAQTRRPDRIYVIDDGSSTQAGLAVAHRTMVAAGCQTAVLHRLKENRGKRHAQAWAFERLTEDIVVTIDSDTVLEADAIAEGLRAFADPDVQAVTGNVLALNEGANTLTRLTSLRYANAFLWERAAYSAVGSVLCCCGSLSLFRTTLIKDHLEDYVSQTFLGVPVSYGDDRRLTNYALQRGRVHFQDTAVASTAVPERFHHYTRQQTRWNKSFFRESLWALRSFRPWTRVWLLTFGEFVLWFAFTFSLVAALVVLPILRADLPSPWYLALLVLMAYARSVRYVGSQRTSLRRQLAIFAMAPLYGLLHITVLTPIRFKALFTLRDGSWGTRSAVEVQVLTGQFAPMVGDGAAPKSATPAPTHRSLQTVEQSEPQERVYQYSS